MEDKDKKKTLDEKGYTQEEFNSKFDAMLKELGIVPEKSEEQESDTKKIEIKFFPPKDK